MASQVLLYQKVVAAIQYAVLGHSTFTGPAALMLMLAKFGRDKLLRRHTWVTCWLLLKGKPCMVQALHWIF